MGEDRPRIILLVEDEPVIALSEQASLQRYGYVVRIARTGEEAVAAVETGAGIDLVLMDIDLGRGIDGTQAAERILEKHDLPIVFLSSHAEPAIVAKTEDITSYGYVVKHATSTVLDASIKMAFRLFETRQTLLRGERRFASLFQNMNEGFALYEVIRDAAGAPVDYRFVEVNDLFLGRIGMSREDLIGRTAFDLFPATERTWIEAFGRVATTGEPELITAYSAELGRHYETHLYRPETGYCAGLFADVTERKNAEEEVRKLSEATEQSPASVVITDLDGRIEYVNPKFTRITGYSREEALGRNPRILKTVDSQADYRELWATITSGKTWRGEFRNRKKNGDIYWESASISPVRDDDGTISHFVGVKEDITDRKLTEEELTREREVLESIVDAMPVMITRYDPSKKVTYLNREAVRKTGWTSDALKTVDFMEQVCPDPTYREEARAYMQRAVCEWREFTIRSRSGESIISEWSNIRLADGTQMGIGIDVTAERLATRKLRESEDRFRSMFDRHHAVMLLIEPGTGRIAAANQSAARFYGFPRDQLLRMTIQQINTLPDDEISRLSLLAARGEISQFVFPHRLADGEIRTAEVYTSPIPTEEGTVLFSIIHDITERRRIEQALRESEAEFHTIFDLATVGIVQVDPRTGRVLRCNKMYSSIVGYSLAELLKISFPELTHPDDREHDWEVFSRAARGETPLYSNEKRYVRKDGRVIWVRLNASFVRDTEGRALRTVAICEDITERKDSERRIRELLAEKETLVREVQHRVKNTMHTMGSLVYMEAGRLSDPNATAALNDMQARFKSMEVLYEQLYRTEPSGTAAVRPYLSRLVRSVVNIFPRSETIEVVIEIDDFALDAKRLSALGMIVNELVTNSMKYAFADRVGGRLTVSGRSDGGRVTISVGDDGPGLPASVYSAAGGSFGMTMVRALVDQLEGTIRFELECGTRAVVEFSTDAGSGV